MAYKHVTQAEFELLCTNGECGLSTDTFSGFKIALWNLLWVCDDGNLARLARGWPGYVQAVRDWRGKQDYADGIRRRYQIGA